MIIPTAAVFALMLHRSGWLPTGWWRLWVFGGVFALAILPGCIVAEFFPQCVDATARGKKIDYAFLDRAYAEQFALINATFRV